MTIAHGSVEQAVGATRPLRIATVGGRTMGITVGVGDEAALARAIEAAKAATDRRAIGDRLSAHVRRVYDWREISAATEAGYYVVLATTSRRRGGWGCGS